MRHPQLHAALRACVAHVGGELARRVAAGDEVPFELLEHTRGATGSRRPGRHAAPGPALYSYRPLVGLYVERHAEAIERLPAVIEAGHAMVAAWGVEAYLEARGVSRPPADPHRRAALAVRLFVERTFEDDATFRVRDDHFDRAFAELDAVLTLDASETVVAIPLLGIELGLGTIAVTRGVALQRPAALRGEVPDAALSGPEGETADAVATLRWAARPGAAETPRRAREAARRLVTALRLHCPEATPSPGPLMWLRSAGGPWRAMALGGTFRTTGTTRIDSEDVHDLRTFVDLVGRRLPERGAVAWALRRWALGMDRDRPEETLSDLLLAGRALLEPEGPGSGRLAGRLAALCATESRRTALSARLAAVTAAEGAIIDGRRRGAGPIGDGVVELGDCLRAVLRDCVCGHLEGDLVALADDILDGIGVAEHGPAATAPPVAPATRRTTAVPGTRRPAPGDGARSPGVAYGARPSTVREADVEVDTQDALLAGTGDLGTVDLGPTVGRRSSPEPTERGRRGGEADVWLQETWEEPALDAAPRARHDDATGSDEGDERPWPVAATG